MKKKGINFFFFISLNMRIKDYTYFPLQDSDILLLSVEELLVLPDNQILALKSFQLEIHLPYYSVILVQENREVAHLVYERVERPPLVAEKVESSGLIDINRAVSLLPPLEKHLILEI